MGVQWTETGSYRRAADHKKGFRFRPKPFRAFPALGKLSLICAAQPRTNQKVEGGFSLASMSFRSYRRNQGPEMWSNTIRNSKLNLFNYGVGKDALKKEFIKCFAESLLFRRKNLKQLKQCYAPDTGESEEKYASRMLEDMPQYVQNGGAYNVTNICDAPEKDNALQSRDRNGGRKQNSRHRVDESPAENREMIRAPVRPRLELQPQAPTSAPPQSRWTLQLLNREKVDSLRELCSMQNIIVHPSRGSSCLKADYVAALLADQDASEAQQFGAQHELSDCTIEDDFREQSDHQDGFVLDSALHGAKPSGGTQLDIVEEEAHVPIAQSVSASVDVTPAVSAMPSAADAPSCPIPGSNQTAEEDLADFIRDCQRDGMDPFDDFELNVEPAKLQAFDQAMNAHVQDIDLEPENSGDESDSDSEAAVQDKVRRNKVFEDVKARRVGVWKREYADALTASGSWLPSKVISTKKAARPRNLDLGVSLKSVTLERVDGKQFTVMETGFVFFLLRTLAGLELIRVTDIYHPHHDKGGEQPVWVQYCRVLSSSEASHVCDRADALTRSIQSTEGETILATSVGSKQLEIERAERAANKKKELHHWGDVFFTANASSLIGGVYWVARANENDLKEIQYSSSLLKGIKDKLPIVALSNMDYVVLGSPFSDSKS
jgi:hypothetical protein